MPYQYTEEQRIKRRAYTREYMRQWRINNPEKAKARNLEYRTKHREKWIKSYRYAGAKYRAANPEKYRQLCRAEYRRNILTRRRYTREHAAEAKKRLKKWIRQHPIRYKAHAMNGKMRRRMRVKTFECDCTAKICELKKAIACHWCGITLTKKTRQIDHIIPIAKGGLHEPDNLTAACANCNIRKSAKLPDEWLSELNRLKEAA